MQNKLISICFTKKNFKKDTFNENNEKIRKQTGESMVTPHAISDDVWERLKCRGGGCQSSLFCQIT